ncbi:beta-lactamase [Fibrella aestuarina BUZ 2]|uniref:Beta-lactamase n=1 Tax=Fibrella aestuarina BUZ 2 TaxID=1166018 RepID=I0K2V6_9BACT|nr:serine hydrolase domain-containing protein [Fibrella aestuarina]CCG98459.1 beta-lactamase [Fibrella aestuarina BUZ 2]
MHAFTYFFSFLLMLPVALSAQPVTASVQMQRTLFNERNSKALYARLTGELQRKMPRDSFSRLITHYAKLGTWRSAEPGPTLQGTYHYKVQFDRETMDLAFGLDQKARLTSFSLTPWKPLTPDPPHAPLPSSNALATNFDRRLDSLVRQVIDQKRPTSLSIGIIDGLTRRTYGYGETFAGSGQIPDTTTVYEIGSITKTMTATLLALAIQAKKLTLKTPVNTFLPDSIPLLQRDSVVVTVETLANHTSGLPRLPTTIGTGTFDPQDPYRHFDRQRLFSYLRTATLASKPGTTYQYSNLGAGLLGTLLEIVWGRSYEQLIQEQICRPLHLTKTSSQLIASLEATMAQGFDDQFRPMSAWRFQSLAGAGAVRSTIADMIRYAQAQLASTTPLSQAMTIAQEPTFAKNGVPVIGLGWHYMPNGWIWHNGGTGGYSSFICLNRRTQQAIVVLTNKSGGIADALAVPLQRIVTN